MRSSSRESGVANSTGLCSRGAGADVDLPGGVAVEVGVRGVAGCGEAGEGLTAAGVEAGERGAAGVAGVGVGNRFQQTVLELGYNFLFTDVDVMWFRDPFRHISMAADIAISSDMYLGDPYSLRNFPNGGFLFVRSSAKTIDFYRAWQQGRWRFYGKHEQDVFNLIKHEMAGKLDLAIQFLDTKYISGFCQLSKDLNKICTLHANCCVGLGAKLHDLRGVLDVWKNYTAGTPDERRAGKFQWKLPGICIH